MRDPIDPDLDVFDVLPDLLLVVRDERIRWVNAAAEQALGPGLIGCGLDDVLAPGERHRLLLIEEQRTNAGDVPSTRRVRFLRRSDGQAITTDLRLGERNGSLIVSARDVTDLTRAETLMRTLAQTFARGTELLDADAILDATEATFLELGWIVGFTEVVSDGSITRRIVAPPNDPIGDYGRSVIGLRLPFERTPILAEVVRTGRALFLDTLPTQRPGAGDGAVLLGSSMERAQRVRSAWCPVFTNGQLTHHIAVTGRDLTEPDFVALQLFAVQLGATIHLHALQSALVRKERLAAVGEMAAVMAHEVRNPLGIIFNALASLQRYPGEPNVAPQLLGIIGEEAERLRRLVTNLLDFSRPSILEVHTIHLELLLRQSVDAARLDPTFGGRTREVAIEIRSEVPPIRTDPFLLRRALVNLVMNALQHVSNEGQVRVDVKFDSRELEIRVHNDGAPIPPEIVPRIFEPFFTTRPAGSGLGLAVVRRIATDLRGRVALDTERRDGASFSLVLPVG